VVEAIEEVVVRRWVWVAVAAASLLGATPAGATFGGENGRLLVYQHEERSTAHATETRRSLGLLDLRTNKLTPIRRCGWPSDSRRTPDCDPGLQYARISPSGKSIVYPGPSGLTFLSLRGRETRPPLPEDLTRSLAWTPDARSFVIARTNVDWKRHLNPGIYPLAGNGIIGAAYGNGDYDATLSDPDVSTRGDVVYDVSAPKAELLALEVHRSDGGRLTIRGGYRPSWSPTGAKIAYAGRRGIYTIRGNGTDRHLISRRPGSPAWSPDGKKIAITTQRSIYVVSAAGRHERRMRKLPYTDQLKRSFFTRVLDWQSR
jgi:hypothetical protein